MGRWSSRIRNSTRTRTDRHQHPDRRRSTGTPERCVSGQRISPITTPTRAGSSSTIPHNNNDPNVPEAGNAAAGPIGTGMTLSGRRNDTVMDNTFSDNGAWSSWWCPTRLGHALPRPALPGHRRRGGVRPRLRVRPGGRRPGPQHLQPQRLLRQSQQLDYGQIVFTAGQPQNCFSGNTAPNGGAPPDLEQTQPTCGKITTAANTGGPLLDQVLCDSGIVSSTCPAGSVYPEHTGVVMHPLPTDLPTMPDPCSGVPANPWCPGGSPSEPRPIGSVRDRARDVGAGRACLLMKLLVDETGQVCQARRRRCGAGVGHRRPEPAPRRQRHVRLGL